MRLSEDSFTNSNKDCFKHPEKVKLSIGADPEFEILHKGKIINIYNVARIGRTTASNDCNCRSCVRSRATRKERLRLMDKKLLSTARYFHSGSTRKSIGTDCCGEQAELRPRSSVSHEKFVCNLKRLFEEIHKKKIAMTCKGNRFAIGGHIHVGFVRKNSSVCVLNENGKRFMLRILDYYIGNICNKANGTARGGYGRPGDWRDKWYGIEYRTPPSAAFSSPMITEIVSKLAILLAKKAIKGYDFKIGKGARHATIGGLMMVGLTRDEATKMINYFEKYRTVTKPGDDVVKIWMNKDEENKFVRRLV